MIHIPSSDPIHTLENTTFPKSKMIHSKCKAMLVFFTIKGIITLECVPSSQTVANNIIKKFWLERCAQIMEEWVNLVSAHNAYHSNNTVLEQTYLSSNLTHCNFFLFPKIKSALKIDPFINCGCGLRKNSAALVHPDRKC